VRAAAHQDAAAIFRELGDRHGEGQALCNLDVALRFKEARADVVAAEWLAPVTRVCLPAKRSRSAPSTLGVDQERGILAACSSTWTATPCWSGP
jgi:hypothetical protein